MGFLVVFFSWKILMACFFSEPVNKTESEPVNKTESEPVNNTLVKDNAKEEEQNITSLKLYNELQDIKK